METTKEIDKELIRKLIKEELEAFSIKKDKELKEFSILERIIRVEEELKAQRELFLERFIAIDKRFETVDKRFEAVDKRFEAVDKRFEAIDKRFEAVDKRFEELIGYMNKRFEAVDKRFEELIGYMNKRFETVDKRFDDMNKRFVQLTWFIGFTTALITTLITVYRFFV
ncbi:MAG: hypothetical protein JRI44_07920 [Deltaproteobacteria bacterium]|nr:hypothetical protein [Deltaproteobacteria bacterium]